MDAVIFDMDGVAIDSERHWREAEAAFLAEHLPAGSALDHEKLVGLSMEGFHAALVRDHGLRMDYERFAGLYRRIAGRIYDERCELMPGFAALLERLRAAGVPLGMASSSPMEFVARVLDRFGLRGRFAAVATADQVGGEGKPSPAVYLAAIRGLAARPGGCVAVEDSRNGVRAAKAAGTACVGLRNGFNEEQDLSAADLVVRRPDELDVPRLEALAR